LGLTAEARNAFGIVRKRFGKDFQRDVAPEFCVARAIDLAHAAGT
jgi:hypothetical protein